MSLERPQKGIYTGKHNDLSRYQIYEVLTRAGGEGRVIGGLETLYRWFGKRVCPTLEQTPWYRE